MRYHEAFGSIVETFNENGVFNGFVNHDANFYIVPHMLQDTYRLIQTILKEAFEISARKIS